MITDFGFVIYCPAAGFELSGGEAHRHWSTYAEDRHEVRIRTHFSRNYCACPHYLSQGGGLAMLMSEGAVSILGHLPLSHRRTITYDRVSKFSWWDMTERGLVGTKIYFARPHHPWERGTNERTNGLVRRYFPKGQKFDNLQKTDIERVAWMINRRPRKILQWRTSCEVFGGCWISSFN